ncbi:MAG: potassium channel protein [Pseudomonadota bacterium]
MAVLIALVIFCTGTAGYMLIEKWTPLDAAYMTAITLSTVGYGEVNKVSPEGRYFTMILIFIGGGYFLYLAGAIMQFVVEGEIRSMLGRRRLDKRIAQMEKHYIVCGYGRIGRILCKQLMEQTPKVVVLEKDPEMVPVLEKDKMLYVLGDAGDESTLLKAGIKQASHLIAALATDADNVFLVLTARQLNPAIYIMARAGRKQVKGTLLAAGANRVESPYDIGAISMGLRLLRPSVSNFLDIALSRKERAIQIEESLVSSKSNLVNVMLKDSGIRQNYNIIIIAIKKADGQMIFNPSFETKLEEGDTVISMGRSNNHQSFHEALNPA